MGGAYMAFVTNVLILEPIVNSAFVKENIAGKKVKYMHYIVHGIYSI